METVASFENKAFLGEHPVITARVIITSTGTEQTLLAGSVIGVTLTDSDDDAVDAGINGLYGQYINDMDPVGILQSDLVVPASGNAWCSVYVHCAALADGLSWADGVSATEQATAIAAMRKIGIFVG